MSRARARKNSATATLFPFLAVLLSTMGVLVVLLVAMASVQVDQAKNQQAAEAEARRQAANTPEQQKLREELASHQSLASKLGESRDEAREALRDAQLRTSQIEENIRSWQDRLDTLRLAIDELLQLDGEHTDDQQQAEKRLAGLQRQIADAEEQVAELEEEAANRPKAYSILPYDGPNGTRRQPIYIECLKDRVVIQPEGIELFAEDFRPELGAANPLAAALRATRAYYAVSGLDREEEPYPLVIARPEGIVLYQDVIQAIDSWDSSFGYQMVGSEKQLDFGTANPELTLVMAMAIENARERQAKLARAAPAAFKGAGFDSQQTNMSIIERVRSGAPLGGGLTAAGNRNNVGQHAGGTPGALQNQNNRLANALNRAMSNSAAEKTDRYADAGSGESTGGVGAPVGGPGGDGADTAEETDSHGQPQGAESVADSARGAQGGLEASGDPHSQQGGTATASASNASQGTPTDAGPLMTGETPASEGSPSVAVMVPDNQQESSASASSSNNSPRAGLGMQRPIQVVVRPDRLIVLHDSVRPTAQAASGRTVMLDRTDGQASHHFSAAIRRHVEDWGIAGSGSYWKPVLVLNVAPGGEQLAKELSTALRANGVEVRFPSTTRR